MFVEALFKAVSVWAASEEAVLAVSACGSYMRGTQGPDSDLDQILVCDAPQFLIADRAWCARFGDIVRTELEDHGLVQSVRAHYADGLEIEFGLTSRRWCIAPMDAGTASVINSGMRILYDPKGPID